MREESAAWTQPMRLGSARPSADGLRAGAVSKTKEVTHSCTKIARDGNAVKVCDPCQLKGVAWAATRLTSLTLLAPP